MKKVLVPSIALSLAACSAPKLEETRHPTGSNSISTASDFSALYIANSANETVTRLPIGGTPTELELPGEPTRITRAGDQVFVSLRASQQVAVLVDDGSTLDLASTIETGAEPFGIVADEAGTRIYVAASLEGAVHEYDAVTLERLRSWDVQDEPRWLALHPAGVLYVGSAYEGTFTWIDLERDEAHRTALPEVNQISFELGEDVRLYSRITGDMAVSPDGEYLAIPAMYLDTTTPVIEPEEGVTSDEAPEVPEQGGYAGGSNERFNPTVVMVQVKADGEPILDDAELVRVQAQNLNETVEGYPSSVTISPDGLTTYVTIEGGAGIATFPTRQADDDFGNAVLDPIFSGIGDATFSDRKVLAVQTDMGPRGVAFTGDDEAHVYSFLDRTVQAVDAVAIDESLFKSGAGRDTFISAVREPTLVSTGLLSPQIEEGRRLFYSTNDARMSSDAVGLSCATCHFDGRADGVTWTFDRGLRQTPSLAGQVSQTEPVRWLGERVTVAEDARVTSQGLMGGEGATEREIDAVAAFIDWTRDVDAPLAANDPEVLAGKAIFERPDVACASCHSGERYTNNLAYDMLGVEGVITRSLVGIAGSPPYFHDGSAKTLREVLDRARDGSMGFTGNLSETEMDQLEKYLRSL